MIVKKFLLLFLILAVCSSGKSPSKSFSPVVAQFIGGYEQLNIPGFTYDYREYFSSIPDVDALNGQEDFFAKEKSLLNNYDRASIKEEDLVDYDQMNYEIDFNLRRIALEKQWMNDGRKIPSGGLHKLSNYSEWSSFFVKKYTSTDITPEEVYKLGESEVARVKPEIKRIQLQLGFRDSIAFYEFLKSDTFYITDKQKVVDRFEVIDQTVRKHLSGFVGNVDLPPVCPMEWPDAGPNTPPGIYLNRENNSYGKDVFQYNFYGGRYNWRAMEWLYMHEAIPGHHLQFSFRNLYRSNDSLQQLFFYSGNAEGWACYVEYFGKEMGLYKDPYSELGKWEWDLVRSARLVIDVGIHYYGWTHEQALEYWKKTIPGQDEIAEREVTRVSNWTAQALSYKVGADFIFKLKEKCKQEEGASYDEKKFHRTYLSFGMGPLEIIEKNFQQVYSEQKS